MQTAPLLLAVLCLQTPGSDAAKSPTSARVVPLQLESKGTASAPDLAATPIDHAVDFEGTLHVWAKAEGLDLRLSVEDSKGKLLAEDEDSGGGKTPYLALVVTKGQKLKVRVSGARIARSVDSSKPDDAGHSSGEAAGAPRGPELHLVPAPESAATRRTAEAARTKLEKIAGLEKAGSRDAARAALAKLVDELVDVDQEGQSERVAAMLTAAGERADSLGALGPAARAWGAAVKHDDLVLDDDHPELQKARLALATVLKIQGDRAAARVLQERVLEVRTRTLPADHMDLSVARAYLSETIGLLGDLAGARALGDQALEVLTRTLPDDHVELQRARLKQSATIRSLGDLAGARALQEKVLGVSLRTLPADHIDLQDARAELAITHVYFGDLDGARKLLDQAHDALTRTLPEDHPFVIVVQQSLAALRGKLGDLAGARTLQEQGLDVASRTLPADHPDLQVMRSNLAATMMVLGDFAGARVSLERVLEVRSRTLPDDHPSLQVTRHNLAQALLQLGDLAGARALQEKGLEDCSRTLPDDHPLLQAARGNLAYTIATLGDLARARELFEKVLEINSRTLPADHPDLQRARNNLAIVLRSLGDPAGARALQEKVLEVSSRTLPADHPDLQLARNNLGASLADLDDLSGARRLFEKALEVQSRTLPADHPDLQTTRLNLAAALQELGEFASARPLQEQALEVCSRTLPDSHANLQKARQSLTWTLAALGERELTQELARDLARARRDAIGSARGALAPRELEEQVASAGIEFWTVVSHALGGGAFEPSPELAREAFSLVESARSVGLFSVALSPELWNDPKLAELRAEESKQSAELVRLAQGGAGRDEINAARQALDRTRGKRQAILSADPKARATMVEPTVERLSATLAADQALLGYWRARRVVLDLTAKRKLKWSERLFAFVVRPGARLSLVDVGPIDVIATAAKHWRDAIYARVERGVAAAADDADARLTNAGQALRTLVFDPLRPALGDAKRVIVALDDALHAIPLEALPEADGLLGERFALEYHLSLRERLWPKEKRSGSELLVALGGANFNAEPEVIEMARSARGQAAASARVAASETAPGSAAGAVAAHALAANQGGAAENSVFAALRGSAWERGFEPLPQTLVEARGIGALYEDTFETTGRAVVLEKREAARESLAELAPKARYLHLATHGWFASESIPSTSDANRLDDESGAGLSMSLEQQVRGSSPMVLCGLALAGANLPKDQLGRVRGLITAEEIASLDLSSCDLAVLSACDTNVGVRRAGQGVASLQKALHMAGAKSVITSLWKVPDEATKELMLDFYRRLWVEKKPKSAALWEAKMKLRNAKDEGGKAMYSTRDWAAWVLTGNPD